MQQHSSGVRYTNTHIEATVYTHKLPSGSSMGWALVNCSTRRRVGLCLFAYLWMCVTTKWQWIIRLVESQIYAKIQLSDDDTRAIMCGIVGLLHQNVHTQYCKVHAYARKLQLERDDANQSSQPLANRPISVLKQDSFVAHIFLAWTHQYNNINKPHFVSQSLLCAHAHSSHVRQQLLVLSRINREIESQ